jgi:hypothetical protein
MEMRCLNCGDETQLEAVVKEYEGRARTPFYLYTAFLLFLALGIFWFYWNKNTRQHNMEYVGDPKIGDVYTIARDSHDGTKYSFMRVADVRDNKVMVMQNHFEYGGFVSHLAQDDYFVRADTSVYTKRQLEQMLGNEEIYSVDRGYGVSSGFNQIQ